MYIKFKDDFGNTATIESKMILPFSDAKNREEAFVLSLTSDYDHEFMYHRSVHETEEEAKEKLAAFSCNTWREV